jgi:glutamine---fructose-6-phosphate transaminase (isomerizing)
MCGIIAVLRRRSSGSAPDLGALDARLAETVARFDAIATAADPVVVASEVAAVLEAVNQALSGIPALGALLGDRLALAALEHRAEDLARTLARVDAEVEAVLTAGSVDDVESLNAALVCSKDALWAIRRDRLRAARAVDDLSAGDTSLAAIETYASIQIALSALDRLEVRGRDSAGLSVLVHGHALDLADPTVARILGERRDPLFAGGAVHASGPSAGSAGQLAFVYKVAAEIGELGDNTAALRAAIKSDELLRLALRAPSARATVLGHTRWASVGIISEPNAHPLDNAETRADERAGDGHELEPFVIAALNGDIDNHADLRALEGLRVAAEITTDAKVIPALISRRIAAGADAQEAFRASVASFEGSVAIGSAISEEPDRVFLALRGSGQALYVGCADDIYVVASEPYGLVEVAPDYLRLDGETMREPGNPASQGQIVVLDATVAGDPEAITRSSYDGTVLPIDSDEWVHAEITTRDVDRGAAPHYLLKEITEAPESFRKTLRGKLVERDGVFDVRLAPSVLPDDLLSRLRDRSIRRVVVIGQGTAAIAGQSLAMLLRRLLPDDTGDTLRVEAVLATEFSGFGLRDDLHDTLVVAISQSGTTTDTNRTVDLARARGAAVVAIVNRRQSDLVDKSDGVLYTSDGRDVEMSVASTKAFYSQIAAGCLLAPRIAEEVAPGVIAAPQTQALLAGLRDVPDAMREVIGRRATIAAAAQHHAPYRRSWALVGNGVNRIAAQELRIKLSELCYKSIACDATEDKKHIDLSAEPLILVCAAGLSGSNADDVGKELAIYRAHKAAAIAIVTDGETRLGSAIETISVPAVHPTLAFVVAAMAGHLFGYEAALAIDATARPLREARALVETLVAHHLDADDLLLELTQGLEPLSARFFEGLRSGVYDGQLDAGAAVRLGALMRYGTGVVPLDSYALEFGKVGTPSTLVEDLTAGLTAVIEQLTRPIDAIKHQAKTVTVGISRSDETLLRVPLVQAILAAGAARDSLSYRALRTLVDLDPAVVSVLGFTRYRVEGDEGHDDHMTIHVVDRGGIATAIRSRTDSSPVLRGTKHRVVSEREVTVARGRSDGRMFVIVPEVKGYQVTGLTLVHVVLRERVPFEVARQVLRGYRSRYAALQDQVTETEPTFRDELLADLDLGDLLTQPVAALAEHWRS